MITQTELKALLHYDPTTGDFTWVTSSKYWIKGAKLRSRVYQKGVSSKAYYRVKIAGKTYKLARLAFLYMLGDWPNVVDHINGDSLDNRWDNLRDCTYLANSQNSIKPITNSSGIKGLSRVTINRNKYLQCQITHNGKTHRKYFKPIEEQEALNWIIETREALCGIYTNHG